MEKSWPIPLVSAKYPPCRRLFAALREEALGPIPGYTPGIATPTAHGIGGSGGCHICRRHKILVPAFLVRLETGRIGAVTLEDDSLRTPQSVALNPDGLLECFFYMAKS
ncbi:hypothetical protein CIB48_g1648 [Xylaria polymorpha]|nr:hypothetical protein CIB48_g1648 [Xylaria polymorpha]